MTHEEQLEREQQEHFAYWMEFLRSQCLLLVGGGLVIAIVELARNL